MSKQRSVEQSLRKPSMVLIREATEADISSWSQMRTALWPDTTDGHLAEIRAYFDGTSIDIEQVYVTEHNAEVTGFIELNLRNFAEGSRSSKVPYIEGWYIKPQFQNEGHGKSLIDKAEEWAIAQGCTELASDAELENRTSIAIHKHLGFKETERVVCFLKDLTKNIR